MYRLAKRLLVSTEEAEDAVQETLMKLWLKRGSLTSYRKPEAFIMTMIKNYCLDRLKSKQAAQISLTSVKEPLAGNVYEADNEHTTTKKIKAVHDLIEQLPEKQKIIIHLRDIEQYDLDEIAEILQMSPVAVRVNLSRARKKIREQLINAGKNDTKKPTTNR